MGFSTGADKMLPQSHRAKRSSAHGGNAAGTTVFNGALGLWGTLGAGAVGVLAWLVVDLGGPSQMASALYAAGGPPSQWAAIRQDINRLAAGRPDFAPGQNQDISALRRRIAMLEGMLTSSSSENSTTTKAPNGTMAVARIGAPRTTAAIPTAKPQMPTSARFAPLDNKIDLPRKPAKNATRPPTYVASRVAPEKLTPGSETAKRSRLAPITVFGLDLGAYESIEVLKRRWQLVEGRHQDILGDLVPKRITEFSADGRVAHRLIAAPLETAVEVARRCASLRARFVPCRQTLGAGEPL